MSDFESADVWCETTRTARKFHRCDEWDGSIRPADQPMHGIFPGQQYIEITNLLRVDGSWQRSRVCMDCMALRNECEQLMRRSPPVGWARDELNGLREEALHSLGTLGRAG